MHEKKIQCVFPDLLHRMRETYFSSIRSKISLTDMYSLSSFFSLLHFVAFDLFFVVVKLTFYTTPYISINVQQYILYLWMTHWTFNISIQEIECGGMGERKRERHMLKWRSRIVLRTGDRHIGTNHFLCWAYLVHVHVIANAENKVSSLCFSLGHPTYPQRQRVYKHKCTTLQNDNKKESPSTPSIFFVLDACTCNPWRVHSYAAWYGTHKA